MWEIGSRGVVGLLSVFVGSVILYNAWGPILILAILLFLVVNTCYSLLINDSLVSPHNLLVLEYAKEVTSELSIILERVSVLLTKYIRNLVDVLKRYYRQRINSNMNRPRRSSYHLSSDSFVKARDSSCANVNINQLTPIPRSKFPHIDNWHEGSQYVENTESVVKHTSTPLVPWRKENMQNGELQQISLQSSPLKIAPLQGRNHTLSRGEETIFSPEGSPWGTSISPKMRAKAGGIKTVQTVAGPLLASTRYNIDTKVYSDVTSPGLTTRLSKYASEINNKLLHQSQYGMGHFPKVNLNATPTPLINTKTAKMRMPVTVRIAQPDAMRYSSSERHKMLNMVCHPENETSPNVVQALREISLKRHASREDVTAELVKKQRTDGIYNDELENLEEMTQKRARDESSKSDEETSPTHMPARPLKRSKGQSCNDILNSLSSSIHDISGVKRKATDISRSSTPDIEKHFKSLDKSHNESFSTFPQTNGTPKSMQRYVSEPLLVINVPISPEQKPRKQISPKGIFNINAEESSPSKESKSSDRWQIKRPQVLRKPKTTTSPVKLADKLFMRAEPQNNEKLRTLIESNVKDKFSVDDKDEIKKKDIVNMRQTSMRARLQSMFDAISGKGANKINPDVVIQAEEIKDPVSTTTSTALTTLNSTTITTNINTSPISSSVVPILKTNSNKKTPTKHVTFSIPSGEPITTTSISSVFATENITSKNEDSKTSETPTSVGFSISTTSSGNSTTPTFSFGTNTSSVPTCTTQGSLTNTATSVVTSADKNPITFNTPALNTATLPSVSTSFTSINSFQTLNTSKSLDITNKLNTSQSLSTPQCTSQSTITTTSTGFTFGTVEKSPSSTSLPIFSQNSSVDSQKITAISLPSATFSSPAFNLTTNAVTNTPAVAAPVFSFGTNNPISQTGKSEIISLTSNEQNTSKIQPPAVFGSVSSNFSFPANVPPANNNSNVNKVETTFSGFKSPITTPTFSFGNTPAVKPGFSFGTTSTTTASTPMFGATNTTPTFGTVTNTTNPVTTSTPTFGTPASTTSNFTSPTSSFGTVNNTNLSFGTSNTNDKKTFGTTSTTTSMFGTPTTVTTSVPFGSNNTQPIFGNSTPVIASAFGTPKTTASVFGSNTNTPTFGTVTSAPSLFSNSNVNATTSSTLPTFGATVSTSNMFNQVNTSVNSQPPAFGSSTTSSLFSGANVNTTISSNSTMGTNSNMFSQSKPPPAFGATSSSFGNSGTSLFGSPSTNSTGFSATSPVTNPPPAFGSTNSTPIFGAQNSGPTATVTQSSSFGFGTTTSNTPSFGSTSTTTAGFGSSKNNNFQTQNNSGINFGTGNNNPPAFGSTSATPFGSQSGNVFGTNNTPAPAFGASVNNNNNNNGNNNTNVGGSFTFGTNQSQTQPPSSFSFGGTNTNTNSSNNNAAAVPFQFGSAASKPATGFNFNAPSSTPNINFGASATPTFNAPTQGTNNFAAPVGGMFSIGTGSTAPRSRTTRSRRQR